MLPALCIVGGDTPAGDPGHRAAVGQELLGLRGAEAASSAGHDGHAVPVVTQAWGNAWEYMIPLLAFPRELRRVIEPEVKTSPRGMSAAL